MKLSTKLSTLTLIAAGAGWSQPLPPQGLQALSATSSKVQLAWSVSDSSTAKILIDRRLLGTDLNAYSTLGSTSLNTYTDTAIDPMASYIYRVRGADATGTASDGSNEIVIGPPPVGANIVSMVRPGLNLADPSVQFGVRPLMTLDSNGDPAVCYSILAPNNMDSDTSADSFLEFVAWDRTHYAWKAPVKAGVTGDTTPTGGGANSYSFARDAKTNAWVIASTLNLPGSPNFEVRLFVSNDNGATWQSSTAYSSSVYILQNPTVAVAGGVVHLSFYYDYNGIAYLTGNLSDAASRWQISIAPLPGGAYEVRRENHLALDSNGNPGIAFFADDGAYNSILGYWRPGDGTATYILDSNQIQNDFEEVKLAYFGTSARIAAQLIRDDQGPSGYDHNFWFVADDGSGNFAAPVGLPSDGNSSLAYGSLALGSSGQASLISARVGGNLSGVTCGDPVVTFSIDLVNWFSCSPYKSALQPYRDAYWPQAAYSSNDKLYIAMTNYDDASPLYGVILWREQ